MRAHLFLLHIFVQAANKDLQKIKKISKGIAEKVQRLYQKNWKI
jgi:hypothetical protein